jgi:uncharacterized cupin superfamily protein
MGDQPLVTNIDEAPEEDNRDPTNARFGSFDKVLTPQMRDRGGSLGVVLTRVPPGRTACPFHTHHREDEVFLVLSGRGTLRYGDAVHELRAGDCVSCPAGSGVAHQLANTGDEDLRYLSIGPRDPDEICTYPDSGKVMVRSLQAVGFLRKTGYMEGEPVEPRIFELGATGADEGE